MRRALIDIGLFPVDCWAGEKCIRVPRLYVYLGTSLYSMRYGDLVIALGARRSVSPGETVFKRSWDFPIRWPVEFHRVVNYNPSRAWTGRTSEVYAIEYGFGWRRRILHLGVRP